MSEEVKTRITYAYCIKFLAPASLASALIGTGGQNIKHIEKEHGVKVMISNRDQTFPNTQSRVCSIRGHSIDALNIAIDWAVGKLHDVYEAVKNDPNAHPQALPDVSLRNGDLLFKLVAPNVVIGGLIGKSGSGVSKLREDHGVGIKCANDKFGQYEERLVSINGSKSQIQSCMPEVSKELHKISNETWFSRWAGNTNSANSLGEGVNMLGISEAAFMNNFLGAGNHYVPGSLNANFGSGGGAIGGRKNARGNNNQFQIAHRKQKDVDHICATAVKIPAKVMGDARGFMLTVSIPATMKGPVIGKGGAGVKEINKENGCKINIQDDPNQPEICSVQIEGSLSAVVSGYMVFMQRFIEREENLSSSLS